jgi:hypothetical protein
MGIPFTTRIGVPSYVVVRSFEKECVLLNLENESYYGLDHIGMRMWQVLTQSENIQAAHKVLLAEYDVDDATLRRELEDLIEKLVEHGLVELHGN